MGKLLPLLGIVKSPPISPPSPYMRHTIPPVPVVTGGIFTEEYVQVQVVNVSTGEYEGNVTVNL
ncbi:MAG: hypothetical protein PUF10_00075 [Bacteroidales bacterium]|nr:hypothetical protein [Bacteroidales bacterium]